MVEKRIMCEENESGCEKKEMDKVMWIKFNKKRGLMFLWKMSLSQFQNNVL